MEKAPRYLIRDRDGVSGLEVSRRLESLRVEEVLTGPQSLVECLRGARDRVHKKGMSEPFIILNARARHLKRTLAAYVRYYHRSRPHLALGSSVRSNARLWTAAASSRSRSSGLHHRYERAAGLTDAFFANHKATAIFG